MGCREAEGLRPGAMTGGLTAVTVLWVPIIRSWVLTRGYALHPGTRNRYEIRYTRTQHRPASRQANDHGRVSGTPQGAAENRRDALLGQHRKAPLLSLNPLIMGGGSLARGGSDPA